MFTFSRSLLHAAALSIALGLAAACGPSPVPGVIPSTASSTGAQAPAATPAARPALTLRDAQRVYAQYTRLQRDIYHARGRGLEKTLAGLALELSRAEYRLSILEDWQPTNPPRVTAVEITLARVPDGQPRWFVVTCTYAGQKTTSRTHLIFEESSATGGLSGWRVVTGSTTAEGQDLPRLARNPEGYAEAVGRDAQDLVTAPDRVARAHAAWAADLDGDSDAGKVLTANGYTSEAAQKLRAERDTELRGQWDFQIRARPTKALYGLRTADGGALVWYGFHERHTYRAAVAGAARINFSQRGRRLLSGGRWYSRAVEVRLAGGFLAVVPAAGAGRRATVVGDWYCTLEMNGQ